MAAINLEEYDVALVDFDGTLVDSEPLHYKAYADVLDDAGYTMPWDFHDYCRIAHSAGKTPLIGTELYRIFPNLAEVYPHFNDLRAAKNALLQERIATANAVLISGAEELLERMFALGMTVVVVTNSTRAQVEALSKRHPVFERIDGWVTVDQYKRRKPDPESYHLAIEQFCKPGDRTIGFEDTARGVAALQAAEVDCAVWLVPPDYKGDRSFLLPTTRLVHTFEGIVDADEKEPFGGSSHWSAAPVMES